MKLLSTEEIKKSSTEHSRIDTQFTLKDYIAYGEIEVYGEVDHSSFGRMVSISNNIVFSGDYKSKRVVAKTLGGETLYEITNPTAGFGRVLDTNNSRIVIGAHSSNTAWIYNLDGTGEIQIPTPAGATQFGRTVAIGEGKVLVASIEDSMAWLYDESGQNMIEIPRPAGGGYDGFGLSAVIGHGKIVIGDKFGDDNSGAVFVYDLSGNLLVSIMALNPAGGGYDYFGESVSINSTSILIGERQGIYEAGEENAAGVAWLVNHDGTNVQRVARMEGMTDDDYWAYGNHVFLTEEHWFVGSFESDIGKVFYGEILEVTDPAKVQMLKPIGSSNDTNSFGISFDIENDNLVVGRHYLDTIYMYKLGKEPYPPVKPHPLIGVTKDNYSAIMMDDKRHGKILAPGTRSIDMSIVEEGDYHTGYLDSNFGKYGVSGYGSLSIGGNNIVDADLGFSIGWGNSILNGVSSVVIGTRNTTNHAVSYGSCVVIGSNSKAKEYGISIGASIDGNARGASLGQSLIQTRTYGTVLGYYNVGKTTSLLEVGGNGSLYGRKNILEINVDGQVSAPDCELTDILDDKALITKEFMSVKQSQLELISENGNTGWRLLGRDPEDFVDIGEGAIDFIKGSYGNNSYGVAGANCFGIGSLSLIDADCEYSYIFGNNMEMNNSYASAMFGATGYMNNGSACISFGYYAETYDSQYCVNQSSLIVNSGNCASFGDYNQISSSGRVVALGGSNVVESGESGVAGGGRNKIKYTEYFSVSGYYNSINQDATSSAEEISNVNVIGSYNSVSRSNLTVFGQWNLEKADTMFEIGAGTSESNKNNIFEGHIDGTLSSPMATVALIDARGNKAIISKEYLVNYLLSSDFGGNIPTAVPAEAGKIWNNNGIVSVS